MFIGEYRYSADAKGRVSVPAKFRDELGESFFVTKGLDQSLFIFPQSEWQRFEEKLKALPLTNAKARAFVRIFYSGATEIEMDKQGRMLIPQNLRDFAGIDKELLVIGVGNRIEVWSEKTWEAYSSPENLSYDDLAEQLEDLGI